MVRFYGTAALLVTTLAFVPCAWAQVSPSSEQIISALKPTAQSVQASGTRGVRRLDLPSEAKAGPAIPGVAMSGSRQPSAAGAAPATARAEAPALSLYVQFASGSAELTPQAMASLDKLGEALSSSTLSPYRFRIEGHTDTVGSKASNLSLSERRAAAVANYVERKFGVNESRLVPVGLGSEHLLVQTPDQTAEARNRRVQIINLGA